METFYAVRDGFIDGTWREAGEPVTMTERQARWHIREERLQRERPDGDHSID